MHGTDSTVRWLQGLTRHISQLFAVSMSAASRQTPVDPVLAATARGLGREATHPSVPRPPTVQAAPALGRPRAAAVLRHSLRSGSRSRLVVIRVAVATVAAGALAGPLSLQHAYWAVAAAVLMLNQGLNRRQTWRRGLERLTGTWVGLGLAAGVIAPHPQGLWLIGAIMVLNFLVEIMIPRNYAVAVVFITAVALLIATGGRRSTDLGALLLARGLDTMVGCAVALAAFLLIVPRGVSTWLPSAMADTLDAASGTTAELNSSSLTTPAAREARGNLQRSALRLKETFDNAVNGSAGQREAAEQCWPAVAATQTLAYRILAEAWGHDPAPGHDADTRAESERAELRRALKTMAAAIRAHRAPPPIGAVPLELSGDVHDLRDALASLSHDRE